MSDVAIKNAVEQYIKARHALITLSKKYPRRIGGNDNLIGRIGEFIAMRFLERRGQRPTKHSASNNPGYDLREGSRLTQVKVITEENQRGRTARLRKPWNQLVLVELGAAYKCTRIGILTAQQHRKARKENKDWSATPVVARSMLQKRGLIGRYGEVRTGRYVGV